MRFFLIVTLSLAAIGFVSSATTYAQEGDDSLRAQALALNNITGDEVVTSKVRELMKDKPALRKLLAEALTMVKESEKEKGKDKGKNLPFNYNGAYILARSAHALRDYDSGEAFYKVCIEHASNLNSTAKKAEIYAGMISLFEGAKKYDESLFVCKKLLDLYEKGDASQNSREAAVRDKMIQILCRQRKFDKAMEMTDGLIKDAKSGTGLAFMFMYRKAEVFREWGKPEDSLGEFKKLQEAIEESDDFEGATKDRIVELYCKYPMSGVYVDAGQPDKSIEILDELVKAQPDNATYHNDLGYVLADNNKRLDDAEKLVRRALELDRDQRKKLKDAEVLLDDSEKDNSAYLDSLAWVYFKQKKYAEARDVMLDVVKSDDAQHMEIYDHLADIYLALGQKDDAVKTWKKAVSLERVTPRDDARKDAIQKKIDANK